MPVPPLIRDFDWASEVTDARSSSNRQGGVCDAVLVQDDAPMGPMRLPASRAQDFIDQFNRVYKGVGMQLKGDSVPSENDGGDQPATD